MYLPPFSAPRRRNKGNSGLFRFPAYEFFIPILKMPAVRPQMPGRCIQQAFENKRILGNTFPRTLFEGGKPQAKEKTNG